MTTTVPTPVVPESAPAPTVALPPIVQVEPEPPAPEPLAAAPPAEPPSTPPVDTATASESEEEQPVSEDVNGEPAGAWPFDTKSGPPVDEVKRQHQDLWYSLEIWLFGLFATYGHGSGFELLMARVRNLRAAGTLKTNAGKVHALAQELLPALHPAIVETAANAAIVIGGQHHEAPTDTGLNAPTAPVFGK